MRIVALAFCIVVAGQAFAQTAAQYDRWHRQRLIAEHNAADLARHCRAMLRYGARCK
jgi:hypothetical protein